MCFFFFKQKTAYEVLRSLVGSEMCIRDSLIDRVATPYSDLPEAHFAMGLAAANADDLMHAQGEFQKALEQRPDWEAAELAYAQLLARTSVASAVESLNEFLVRKPDARDTRLALARLLISERKYVEARAQFDILLKDGTVIENNSPCFVVNADYTRIRAESKLGAQCIPTLDSNGIDVKAGVIDLIIEGIDFAGTSGTDGIHFAGDITDLIIADN